MQKHTIIILLLLLCFLGNECRAQSSIYFMGNPGDSETIQDFIVENDSSAIALMNLKTQNNEQSVNIIHLDTVLNIMKSKRYFQPGISFRANRFSNKSNNKIAGSFQAFDIISGKIYTSVNLFDANFDTLSALRFYHSTEHRYGFIPYMLDNDTLYCLIGTNDSVSNPNRIDVFKIDLVSKSIFNYKTIQFPQGKILGVETISYDHIQKEIALALVISTDSTRNYNNPLFVMLNTDLQITNTLFSTDTISFTNGNVDIISLGNNNFLLGYYKKSNIPGVDNYFLGEFKTVSGFKYMKIIPAKISIVTSAKKWNNSTNTTALLSMRTTIEIDSAGNIINAVNHLTNPAYTFSNFSVTGINIWNNKTLLTGSFNFGSPNFDATFSWIDSNLISCDHTPANIVSIDTAITFTPIILQITDTICPLVITNETYQTDSLWFPLTSYCNNVSLVDDTHQLQVRIYPNPCSAILNIDLLTVGYDPKIKLHYRIRDIAGRSIISNELAASSTEVNISNLTSGIYILSLMDGNKYIHHSKIIKQ